ncbi:hypothetical protein EG68_02705 [Paragonimus skrjabini miyazakii]|uniref:tRNA-splicing endonuclease subunit Sen54 N-terminal domain-containing protein n=1 Tax=Paragonimus skrjabini miyazakii TaxID=59628 RepID=A0A8S9Z2G0_9TREM|nr:hypothetical protein EG68_02705 [Paragonimus skrjabini miyazakii]
MDRFLHGKELSIHSEKVSYVDDRSAEKRKYFDNSTESELQRTLRRYYSLLAREHINAPTRMSHGIIADNLVKLQKIRGKYFRFFGLTVNGEPHLHPEEAVYLAQADRLQIWDRSMPMSLMQIYTQLLDSKTYPQYLIYAKLLRRGFVLRKRYHPSSYSICYTPTPSAWTHHLPESLAVSYTVVPSILFDVNCEQNLSESNDMALPSDVDTLVHQMSPLSFSELATALQAVVKPQNKRQSHSPSPEFLFDGYGASGRDRKRTTNFSKRSPLVPDFILCKTVPSEIYPTLFQEDLIKAGLDPLTSVVLAIVDGSDLFFHCLRAFTIPKLQISDYASV